jgi:hypothetical protein
MEIWYTEGMKSTSTGKMLCGLILVLLWGFSPLYGADERDVRIEVNLIIDGSAGLARVLNDVNGWLSANLVDLRLREGDQITIWSAGGTAEIVYADTLKNDAGKESVKKALQTLSAKGDSADFAGALRDAVSRSSGKGIIYTLLVSASAAALSPTLLGPQANLVRFSRIEEFRGWRALVVGLNIESRVRQAASAYISGI